jgi:hypothetical protein
MCTRLLTTTKGKGKAPRKEKPHKFNNKETEKSNKQNHHDQHPETSPCLENFAWVYHLINTYHRKERFSTHDSTNDVSIHANDVHCIICQIQLTGAKHTNESDTPCPCINYTS